MEKTDKALIPIIILLFIAGWFIQVYFPAWSGNTCESQVVTIVGTDGDDILTGTPNDDVIHGLAGNDVIKGLQGNDRICGGSGNWFIFIRYID